MSETIDDLEVEFPKTVTACHAEITRLDSKITKMQATIDRLENEVEDKQTRLDEIDQEETQIEALATEAINALLDEVVRVGVLRFDVPQTDRANRAIVALHDAVGRHP